MVRIRSGLLVAVAALGLGAGACKKTDDKGNSPTSADKTSEPGAAKSGDKGAIGGQQGDDLSLIPADSEMVMGINIGQIQQSALWKQFGPKLMEQANKNMAEWKAACGIEPMSMMKSMSFGAKNVGGSGDPDVTMVIHGLDKAKLMGCFDKAKEEAVKSGTELNKDGDVVTIKAKDGKGGAFTWVNDSTVVGVMGAAGTKDGVMAAAKGGSGLKTSQAFIEMYSKINTGDSFWILINGNSPLFQKAGGMGMKPKAVFGSINVTDGLTLDGRVRFGTPDEATQLANMVKGQVNNPQIKQMVDKLDVSADGTDMKLSVAMSNQKLQQVGQMAGAMMGGMMGGGMGGP